MKNIVIETEQELLGALRAALAKGDFPPFRLEEASDSSGDARARLELKRDGRSVRLTVKLKLEAEAEVVRKLAEKASASRKPAMLVTVKLPESLARKCREAGISHADLSGRIWIKGKGLLIDRNVPDPAVRYRTAGREVDFFSPKSCRVARVLLSNPGRTWRQADLTKAAALSQGLVSRLLNHAAKLGWVDGRRGDWRLVEPDAVLDAWEKADAWRKRVTLRQYSTHEVDLTALARRVQEGLGGEIAFTQWFAANLRFPYTQPPVVSIYRRRLPTEEEQAKLGLREVGDGGRLWFLVPRDEGVFQEIRQVEGFPLVCDVQIYLDLLSVGLRGPDQAKALREWEGFRKP